VLALAAALYVYAGFGGPVRREQIQPVLGSCRPLVVLCPAVGEILPASAAFWRHPVLRLLMGLLILLPAWFAAVYLLHIEQRGAAVVVLVWWWPRPISVPISRGGPSAAMPCRRASVRSKTWEGFWGGVFCAGLLAALICGNSCPSASTT
jgi:phosphatidate cytidylyltransferase